MPVKETCCTHCSHLHVCALKSTLIAAQEAIDRVHVTLQEDVAEPLSNIEFIKPVTLECVHFHSQIAIRTPPKSTFGTMEIH